MTRPVLWSAAAHLLVIAACLLVGAGRGPADGLLPVVEVHLVGREPGPGGAESSGPGPPGPLRLVPGLPPPPRGEKAPSPMSTDGRVPRAQDAQERPRAEERPMATTPTPLDLATVAVRTADPAARPASPSAPGPATAIPARPAASGPEADTGPALAGPAPGGAPRRAATVPAGGGAGPGGTGEVGDRPRPGGEIGLLRERIQSRIVYPDEAVRRGLEGEVLLRIHIETGGIPKEIRVARSSGARLLDDAARRGVVRAAPLPSSPGWVEVPVRFRLR